MFGFRNQVDVLWYPAPPPPHSVLFRVYARTLFLKALPIWGLPTFPNPPPPPRFAGFSRAFPALETPLNQEKCSMYPPKFGIISQESKEMREKKKNTPFLKKSPGEKSNTPLFFTILGPDFVARKVYPLPDILATRMRSFRPLIWGGGGGGLWCPLPQVSRIGWNKIECNWDLF